MSVIPATDTDFQEVAELQEAIEIAMLERLPQLSAFLVRPFEVSAKESNTWVVARAGSVALCISLETERFGVGFLSGDIELGNADSYPTPELAAQAFNWAAADSA